MSGVDTLLSEAPVVLGCWRLPGGFVAELVMRDGQSVVVWEPDLPRGAAAAIADYDRRVLPWIVVALRQHLELPRSDATLVLLP